MLDHLAADAVLVFHLGFVLFVVFGGALVLRWPRLAWLHVPAVFWGVLVELTGWICPLTPLENVLRASAGGMGYRGDFVQHYIVALIYPDGLTRGTQMLCALLVVALNALLYGALIVRLGHRAPPRRSSL
ncbi:MAG TPA: DUF2784 domain-containing protein [Casimicrobiaceae bacterium]|nr:DUF2784 domain-containing protein [Casimicrobiaceae bacterium]